MNQLRFIFPLVFVSCISSLHAATIAWNKGTITNENDVVTNGSLVYAYSFGNPNVTTPNGKVSSTTPVVNGVTFTDLSASSNTRSVTNGDFTISLTMNFVNAGSPQTTELAGFTGEYEKLLTGGFTATGSGAANLQTFSLTFNNLTIGNTYIVQIWSNTSQEVPANPGLTFSNASDLNDTDTFTASRNLENKVDSCGEWVTAQFTADSDQMKINMAGTNYIKIGAVQLRDLGTIPEPSTAALALLAGAGLLFNRKRRIH